MNGFPDAVRAQLHDPSCMVEGIVKGRFRPVLVSRNMRRDKQNELRRAKVRFRKRPEIVRQLICGDPLTVVLGNS